VEITVFKENTSQLR